MPEKKRTILLVEDDPITAVSGKLMLESSGYAVFTASSGRKAVDAALNTGIDLILMDIELGGDIDGNMAARMILEKKNVPIVFLTAHIEREMVEKVRSITRYGYALKNSGDYVLLSSIEMVFQLFEAHEKTRISEESYRRLVEDISDTIFSLDSNGLFTYISPRVEDVIGYKAEELIGRDFSDLTYEEDKEKAEMLLFSLQDEGECKSEFRKVRRDGDIAWVSVSLRPVIRDGIYCGATGILSDISERKRSDEKVKALLAEKVNILKEINCLYNISRISEEHPLSIDSILRNSVQEILTGFAMPGSVYVRIKSPDGEYSSGNLLASEASIKNDIIVNRMVYGKIEALYNVPFCFNEREMEFIGAVADRLGRIIELAMAKNELRELEKMIISISEGERQKIGREIHDSLGQLLTGMSFMLKTVKNSLTSGSSPSIEKINEISDIVYEATMICRKITRGLPMNSVSHDNIVLAIDQLAINTRNMYQMNCEFVTSGGVAIKDDFTSSQLYYIALEAINNAAKHSGAGNVKISLGKKNGLISLEVHDDGKGRDADDSGGLGLGIMKYRSDLIGGTFRAENHNEQGFLVSVDVPIGN